MNTSKTNTVRNTEMIKYISKDNNIVIFSAVSGRGNLLWTCENKVTGKIQSVRKSEKIAFWFEWFNLKENDFIKIN